MSRLPDRIPISPIRRLVLLIALAGLSACDLPVRVEGCAERFAEPVAALGRDPQRSAVRYAFELRDPDAALLRNGIDGVPTSRTVSIEGPDSQVGAEAEVERLMSAASPPGIVHIAARSSWLVYIPARAFSATEGRRHLGAMCALSSRGALLRRFDVSPQAGQR